MDSNSLVVAELSISATGSMRKTRSKALEEKSKNLISGPKIRRYQAVDRDKNSADSIGAAMV